MTQPLLSSPQPQTVRLGSDKVDSSYAEYTSTEPSGVDAAKTNPSTKSSNLNKQGDFPKVVDTTKVTDASKCVNSSESDFTWSKRGCTVQFERRFIEVDDELVSVITDIEGNCRFLTEKS